MFFKSKPNLPDADKARIEFHFQQLAECIGIDRLKLPLLSMKTLLGLIESKQTPAELLSFVGEHLAHDVRGIQISVVPEHIEKCGGGG